MLVEKILYQAMPNKNKKVTIVIEMPAIEQSEPRESLLDIFIYKFLKVLTYWIIGFISLGMLGIII